MQYVFSEVWFLYHYEIHLWHTVILCFTVTVTNRDYFRSPLLVWPYLDQLSMLILSFSDLLALLHI